MRLGLLCIVLVISVTESLCSAAPPTTQPSPKPITSLEQVIRRLPAEDRPRHGEAWNDILAKRAAEWFTQEVTGKEFRGRVFFLTATKGDDSVDVGMEYPSSARGARGAFVEGKLDEMGFHFLVGMDGKFAFAWEGVLSRMRGPDGDKHGTPMLVTGKITKASLYAFSDPIRLSIELENCTLIGQIASSKPTTP